MNKKLIFRILGAIASALIIVSVFIPFVSVTGYTQSLWGANKLVGTTYLPIMIIVFGAIGVLFFSLNIKTELAYTSAGALTFYIITQTVPIIKQGTFGTLGVGYYCLVVGTILTALMAFLCNLKSKIKVIEEVKIEQPQEISMLNQIDRLYENLSTPTTSAPIEVVDNSISPLQDNSMIQPIGVPAQDINNNVSFDPMAGQPMQTPELSSMVLSNSNIDTQMPNQNLVIGQVSPVETIQPLGQNMSMGANPVLSEFGPQVGPVETMQPMGQNMNMGANPVLSEFGPQVGPVETMQPMGQNMNMGANPVLSEFGPQVSPVETVQPMGQNMNMGANPVLSEFGPQVSPVETVQPMGQNMNIGANPTLSEFEAQANVGQFGLNAKPQSNAQPSASTDNKNSGLDIFG